MLADIPTDWALIRRQAATVRMLLEELDQLTGPAASQVNSQLAEELVVLARRLVEASLVVSGAATGSRSFGGAR